MKGIQGLIVAAGLGLLAAALNYLYLSEQSRGFTGVNFIVVKSGVAIRPGDVINESHLDKISVPKASAENLKEAAYLWQDLNTVVGIKATREYKENELLFRSDYRTPRPELALKANERLIWVTVDSRAFVPELVDPGDEVTFILPTPLGPTPAAPSVLPGTDTPEPVRVDPPGGGSGAMEMVGPFKVGSLGNRLGRTEVMRASSITPVQQQQIGIVVRWEGNKLEANAMKLQDRLARVNYSNVSVVLHPRAPRK